jgi:hypothetical protein
MWVVSQIRGRLLMLCLSKYHNNAQMARNSGKILRFGTSRARPGQIWRQQPGQQKPCATKKKHSHTQKHHCHSQNTAYPTARRRHILTNNPTPTTQAWQAKPSRLP